MSVGIHGINSRRKLIVIMSDGFEIDISMTNKKQFTSRKNKIYKIYAASRNKQEKALSKQKKRVYEKS